MEVATGVITFLTFIKDITAIAMAVKDAIDKTGDNIQDAKDACEDILLLLEGLVQIGEEHGDQTFTRALSHSQGDWLALKQLKRDLLRFHKAYMVVIANPPSSHSAYGWHLWDNLWNIGRQQSIAKDLAHLKGSVDRLMRRFQALATAELHQKVLGQTEMLQRAEHVNRLVINETPGGRRAILNRTQRAQALRSLPQFLHNWFAYARRRNSSRPLAEPWKETSKPRKQPRSRGIRIWVFHTSSLLLVDSLQFWKLSDEACAAGRCEYVDVNLVFSKAVLSASAGVARSLVDLDGEEGSATYSYYYDALLPAPNTLIRALSECNPSTRPTGASDIFYWKVMAINYSYRSFKCDPPPYPIYGLYLTTTSTQRRIVKVPE